ncbi:M48 family metallopeptidase [Pseudomonadota bacterium]
MSEIYPPGPSNVPDGLTKPSAKYKSRAWVAVLGLVVFVVLYFVLAAWFSWTGYRLMSGAFEPGGNLFLGLATGLPAAFLALFMLKALFFVKRGQESDDVELKPEDEPKLFEFLNKLADDAGAPRPHRVYVSPRVNAAVFYDLSIFNLFFPSKKNLEIGLGLVNVLNLGELKAVLAHEFGHFAQRSMAVGSWVYIAHQIAAHIITQRDIFDKFIHGLSRFDLRIAWVGWVLRLVVWSIRSLLDTVFSVVVIAQRALSREMEFQADLVAVSLTGSDALIHALHKLNAADEAWDRSLSFLGSEAREGRAVADVFIIQKRIIQRLGLILNDPTYGQIPPLPDIGAEKHRLFSEAMATPPRMWATHPENSAREENAKQTYVAAAVDERSGWSIFHDSKAIRARMSAHLLDASELTQTEPKASIETLDKQFNKAYFAKKFKGAYLGRSITRYAEESAQLYSDYTALQDVDHELNQLYQQSLSDGLEKLRVLYEEQHSLEGIHSNTLHVGDGVIRHRGKQIKRNNLPKTIRAVQTEIAAAEKVVQEHDIRCRTTHLAVAHRVGNGWEENLKGLLALLHYADHAEANLHDIHGYVSNIVAVITADDRVSKRELKRLLKATNLAFEALAEVYATADQVQLGRLVGKQLEIDDWKIALGEFNLVAATKENINEWMNVFDGWMGTTINALAALKTSALEQLLKVEGFLEKHHRSNAPVPNAPPPPKAPVGYATLLQGQERKRQTKLDLWNRFYTASGVVPATFRFAVAASIVGAVVYTGHFVGSANVTVFNGLANTVDVSISGQSVRLAAFQYAEMELPAGGSHNVTTTINDNVVESFDVETSGGFGDYIYSVAHATPLFEWTEVYGDAQAPPSRNLGAPRWMATTAQVLFEEPPESVQTKSGGATRTVLEGYYGNSNPRDLIDYIDSASELQAMVYQHAVWDSPQSTFLYNWLGMAFETNDVIPLLKERLSHYPNDVIAMRLMQDYAPDEAAYDAVCKEHSALAEQNTRDANLQYLLARCLPELSDMNRAFIEGEKQWPDNVWFQLAAGYTYAELGDWDNASRTFGAAMNAQGPFKNELAVDLTRLKRLHRKISSSEYQQLADVSYSLVNKLRLESGEGLDDSPYRVYSLMNIGDLKAALIAAREMEAGQTRSLRMIAASDGSSKALVKEVLTMSTELGMDESTIWITLGLALREGKDSSPYEAMAKELQGSSSLMLANLGKVQVLGAYDDFEEDMLGLELQERGYLYSAASLSLGNKAPRVWKAKANRLLFASERPYFKTKGG